MDSKNELGLIVGTAFTLLFITFMPNIPPKDVNLFMLQITTIFAFGFIAGAILGKILE